MTRESFAISYLTDFDWYLETGLNDLRKFQQMGLTELNAFEIQVTPKGQLLARDICMVFERYLVQDSASTAVIRA